MFRFTITIHAQSDGLLVLTFTQVFTSISEKGNALIKQYEAEDFTGRLKSLQEFMDRHLEIKMSK
jgi:hypothetical protein